MSRRLNGTGTLINKGHGKPYLARWSDGKGHVIYRTTGETRRSEALKVLAQFVRPFQEDHEIKVLENLAAKVSAAKKIKAQDEAEAKGIELDEIADHIDKNLAFADTTASSRSVYKGYVVTLVDWMKANRPDVTEMKDVTEDDARAFLEGTVDKVCSNLYNFRLVLYRRLWRVLQSEAHCSENPWMKFNKRKAEKHSMRRELTREELAKIFKFVKDDDEMTLAFATGLYTGLRRGDVCDLKWSEVDFPSNCIVVVPRKTRRHMPEPLRLPIHPRLRALLNARKAKVEAEKIDDGGYVMPSLAGASKTKTVSERIANVFDKCGITRKVKDDRGLTKSVASFHSLRHTFVSYSLQAGVPLSVIQRVVGHSSASMTSHYFHANEAVIADGMAKLPDLMVKSRGKGKPQGFKTLALTSEIYELLMKRVGSGDVSDYLKRLLTATEKAVATLDPMKAVA